MTQHDHPSVLAESDPAASYNYWKQPLTGDPHAELQALRAKCPVGRSAELGGYWIVSSYDAVREVLINPSTYSSRVLTVPPPDHHFTLVPETFDPPEHTAYRRLLTPLFSPARMKQLTGTTRQLANALIKDFVAHGGGDFMKDVAVPLPSQVFLALLGLPQSDVDRLLVWKDGVMRDLLGDDPERREHAEKVTMPELLGYFQTEIDRRRSHPSPPDDVLSGLVFGEVDLDGTRLLTDAELISALIQLFTAGLDTVTAVLSLTFEKLATDADLRRRLVDQPGLVPDAVEEFLRYFSIVTVCREATEDALLAGVQISKGDYVAVSTPAASRDPQEFVDPEQVIVERQDNRHLAFGAGPHRCLGSHLARMEMAVAIEEALSLMPDFALTQPVEHHYGSVIGCAAVHLAIGSVGQGTV